MIKIKAWNVSKTQSNRYAHGASLSQAIAKFHKAEIDYFGHKMFDHDLTIGPLRASHYFTGEFFGPVHRNQSKNTEH